MFTLETGSVRMTSHFLWAREWLWGLTPLSTMFQLYRGGQFDFMIFCNTTRPTAYVYRMRDANIHLLRPRK